VIYFAANISAVKKINTLFATVTLVAITLTSCKENSKEKSETAMFRGDEKHSGIYSSNAIADNPKVKWKFKTNGYVNSSPALAGDRLYAGSSDSNLYCLDATSGALIWKFKTNGIVNSSPAVVKGIVYFSSYDGNFYALDATNGNVKWKFTTAGEKRFSARGIHGYLPKDSLMMDDWDFYTSSPLVYDHSVYSVCQEAYE